MAATAPRRRTSGSNGRAASNGHSATPIDPLDAVPVDDYEFTHDGQTYRLPSFAMLKSGLIRRIRNMDQADAFYAVLEEVADEDTLAAVDDMPMIELGRVMRGWQQHAKVSLGESRRSST